MEKRTLCLYFQVHQPIRLRKYHFFDIGKYSDYYDDFANRSFTKKIAERCYLPANRVLLELIKKYGKNFKVAFSITGLAIEQFRKYAPEVIDSFKALAGTGCVEFLAETYSHSLACLVDETEFKHQVKRHADLMKELFGMKPVTFRNTELVYSDEIGEMVAKMGYTTMLTEGARHILGWKSPNYLYTNSINPKLKLLLKNFRLSDDIAFRFSDRQWDQWPLTAEKYVSWLDAADGEIVNLFMDYETFGEHQNAETGIFDFLAALPGQVFSASDFEFLTPKEAAAKHQPVAPLHVPYPISWADEERDLTAWLGNELQNEAFEELYKVRDKVNALKDESLTHDYNCLQASDHFYYMCTKLFADGDIHRYFTPYDTPYEAFINYMNVLSDFILRVEREYKEKKSKTNKETKKIVKG
ncbi:MAG TPA: glycoside hydrolase family 57 protein [Candidatus Odoribacter faecigallinarum]|jgi:alpha-amylase|uniref:Glycoside hydrolase family 57 protein n=1 Tax=Candidatus Odoribacter faecigallinarum TaxID=2838706 RepID=A0A9D1UYI9_9BACT|nr:glycoside hydrolase family 57 protein [Candidatus Odoribacter faecigallinarum]